MKNKTPSQPIYKIKAEKNVFVTMRDGVKLAVDIYRPDASGKFPALFSFSSYGKERQVLPVPYQPPQSTVSNASLEAGDTEYIVSRGYAHVIGDERGSGKSGGKYRGPMSKQEGEDGYDIVEWIARQPWCTGNIGMVGISYFGGTQIAVAAEQPPHLKAIFPFDTGADFYRDRDYHGGILTFFHLRLAGIHGAISVTAENMSPEGLNHLVEETKKNPDIQMYPNVYEILENPHRNPSAFDLIVNPVDGPYYWERSHYKKYDRIKIPAFCGAGWWAYDFAHLPGAFKNYSGINAPKKLMIGPMIFLERPFHQYHDIIIRWYDHWLKGIDTGIMDELPIKLFVMGINKWRYENEWPLARTQWIKYYLRSWERLSTEPETSYLNRPDCFVQMPPDMSKEIVSLKYMTAPMVEDTEVTGPITLYLYAAIDADDTNWIVALKDVGADNRETELTRGYLKASHRAIDRRKSKPWQPFHPHLKPEPAVPGEIYEYAIEIRPTSNVFKVGHRIKLEITNRDEVQKGTLYTTPEAGARNHLCVSKTVLHKIFRDVEHQSYLLLPIIPNKAA